jgi:glutamate synthase (NADPH/NADH) large chain
MVTDALRRKLLHHPQVVRPPSRLSALASARNSSCHQCRHHCVQGLLLADQVGVYYKDLQIALHLGMALVHQLLDQYNFPQWPLAHRTA